MPLSKWELYHSKLVGKKSSADLLIRSDQDAVGSRRQIKKCVTDLTSGKGTLAAGITEWEEAEENQNLKNYFLFNDACLKMEDKFEFLRKLFDQFISVRTEEQADAAYEKEIEDSIKKQEPEIARASLRWERISASFVEKMNKEEEPREEQRKEATVAEEDTDGREKEEKTPNEQAYRPKE